MNAITVEHVTKHYPGFSLQDVSFSLPQGSILGLVGENGAGKSTLIRLLMGAAKADSGTLTALNTDSRSPDFAAAKEDIGIVLDDAYFPEVLSAKQVGKVMAHTYQNWDPALYQQYLQQFSLPGDKLFKDYSRGMRMKLAIAVALSHHPRLLVLDEATSGLDPMVRDEILDIFNDFTRDESHSILLSSHIVSDLEKICDYIAFLHKGKLLLFEEKDRLLEEYTVLRLTSQQLSDLDPDAVISRRSSPYGEEALARARDRSGSGGDNWRGKNQLRIIQAAINKVLSPAILSSFSDVLKATEGSFQTDVPYELIAELVRNQLAENPQWEILRYNVTGTGDSEIPFTTMLLDGKPMYLYVMWPNEDDVAAGIEMMQAMHRDEVISLPSA